MLIREVFRLRRNAKAIRSRLSAGLRALSFGLDSDESSTFHPDQLRKSRPRILYELVSDAVVAGRVNEEYFLYGEDLAQARRGALPSKRAHLDIIHRQIRSQGAQEQAALLRDKLGFARFLEEGGFPVPSIVGIAVEGQIQYDNGDGTPVEDFLRGSSRRLFAKPVDGAGGRGAHLIEVTDEAITVDGHTATWGELPVLLEGKVLLQEVVEQHPSINAIYSSSVNTLRMVTLLKKGRATLIACVLRLGNDGAVTDNFSGSGIAVPVDIENGQLRSPGYYRTGSRGRPLSHPNSGIKFKGFDVPHFSVCREMVEEAHVCLGGLVTVGWDVAITPQGPLIIEANAFWTPRFHIATDAEFLSRYVPSIKEWLTSKDMRWARPYLVSSPC